MDCQEHGDATKGVEDRDNAEDWRGLDSLLKSKPMYTGKRKKVKHSKGPTPLVKPPTYTHTTDYKTDIVSVGNGMHTFDSNTCT